METHRNGRVTSASSAAEVSTELASRRTGMSFQRTRLSADRTLMSVIRTSLSLIGFTIFQVFQKAHEAQFLRTSEAPRHYGEALVWLGLSMLVIGIVYHVMFMLGLRRDTINLFGRDSPIDSQWAGWVYATDADSGIWKWRAKSNFPIIGAMTPTAGGIVFFGDVGGNFYALDSSTGQKLWGQVLDSGGGIGGGIITYTANGAQKIAVADGFTMVAWPTKPVTAKIVILGLDNAGANK